MYCGTCTFILILFVCCDFNSGENILGDAPVAYITDGALRGKILISRAGKHVYAYLGIPYTKPPIGNLRFTYPHSVEPWEGIRDATKDGARCPQLTYPEGQYEGQENCLYLNVYTKKLGTGEGESLSSVVVLIHGGGFTYGSGDSQKYGPDNLLDEDIVLVTFNYRLGALGFLSTGDEAAAGNYGLKDQVDALRWVRRHISRFGGNPGSVTVLGAQAGAASAHFHMLSPLSNGLLVGAVSQSGTALCPWALVNTQRARERAFKLGELLGCKVASTTTLVECLRNKPAEEIVKQSIRVIDRVTEITFPFVPIVEPHIPNKKPFLGEQPSEMIRRIPTGAHGIPWITSVASHEGLPQALQAMVYPSLMDNLNSQSDMYVLRYLSFNIQPESKARSIGRQIWKFYFQNETLHFGNIEKLAQMVTDYNYFYPLVRSVRAHTAASDTPVFVYQFSYNRRNSRFSLGVPQGDDTEYLFPTVIAGKKFMYDEDWPITNKLLHIINNFAAEGDPTGIEFRELDNLTWPIASSDNFAYVDIGKNLTVVNDGFYLQRMTFWNDIMKQVNTNSVDKDEL